MIINDDATGGQPIRRFYRVIEELNFFKRHIEVVLIKLHSVAIAADEFEVCGTYNRK